MNIIKKVRESMNTDSDTVWWIMAIGCLLFMGIISTGLPVYYLAKLFDYIFSVTGL